MTSASHSPSLDDPDNPLAAPRKVEADANFDVTAMIDLVFMMNIYFLVTTLGAAAGELNLPAAKHCVAADRETSVMVVRVNRSSNGKNRRRPFGQRSKRV